MIDSNLDSRCAVVLLVINQIQDLPVLAINSILQNSDSPIFIGTVRDQNRENLPRDGRITYVDLSIEARELGIAIGEGSYESFEKNVLKSGL